MVRQTYMKYTKNRTYHKNTLQCYKFPVFFWHVKKLSNSIFKHDLQPKKDCIFHFSFALSRVKGEDSIISMLKIHKDQKAKFVLLSVFWNMNQTV